MKHRWIASCARRRCPASARGTRRGFVRGFMRGLTRGFVRRLMRGFVRRLMRRLTRARAEVARNGVLRPRWWCWRAGCTLRLRGRRAASLRLAAWSRCRSTGVETCGSSGWTSVAGLARVARIRAARIRVAGTRIAGTRIAGTRAARTKRRSGLRAEKE